MCKFLEMREFKWESIKNITSVSKKFKRALLQFTPERFMHNRWLDPNSGYMRLLAVIQLMLVWQMVELNTFFIKHIFPMPAEHPVCIFRMLFLGLVSAPSCRQYYSYITDPQCKRVGTQCWVFIMIGFSELILVLKFGVDLFSQTQISKLCLWFCLNILVSCLGVFVSMEIFKWRYKKVELTASDEIVDSESKQEEEDQMPVEDKVERYLKSSSSQKEDITMNQDVLKKEQ